MSAWTSSMSNGSTSRTPGTSSILNPSVEPEVTYTAALLSQAGVGIE
ncbi:hypothetical protein [Kitasatospora sp. NPDC056731]